MDEDFTDVGWTPKESPDCGRCCDRGWVLRGPSGRRRCPECNPGRVRVLWNRIVHRWRMWRSPSYRLTWSARHIPAWFRRGYEVARHPHEDEPPPF